MFDNVMSLIENQYWSGVQFNGNKITTGYKSCAAVNTRHNDYDEIHAILSGPYMALSGPYMALSGPYMALSGPSMALSGPYMALSAPYMALSGPYMALSGPYMALSGPYMVLSGPYMALSGPYMVLSGPYTALKANKQVMAELRSMLAHIDRKSHEIVFCKCTNPRCDHCTGNPPNASSKVWQYMKEREFKWPNPLPSVEHPGHYMTYLEIENLGTVFWNVTGNGLPNSLALQRCPYCPNFL